MTIRETIVEIHQRSKELERATDDLRRSIVRVEQRLRHQGLRRVISTTIVSGVELAWSADGNWWRLVIRDGDDVVRLLEAEPDEWIEAINTGALTRIVESAKSN